MQTPSNEKAPKSFVVRVEHIPELGLEIDETLSAEWLTALLVEPNDKTGWQARAPVETHLSLTPEAGMVHLRGGGAFSFAHPCVRCMEEAVFEVPLSFNMRLFASTQAQVDTEHDLEMFSDEEHANAALGEDGEFATGYFQEGVIDLSALLREQLFLDLPAYPTCDHEDAVSPKVCQFAEIAKKAVGKWGGGPLAKLIDLRDRLPKS